MNASEVSSEFSLCIAASAAHSWPRLYFVARYGYMNTYFTPFTLFTSFTNYLLSIELARAKVHFGACEDYCACQNPGMDNFVRSANCSAWTGRNYKKDRKNRGFKSFDSPVTVLSNHLSHLFAPALC